MSSGIAWTQQALPKHPTATHDTISPPCCINLNHITKSDRNARTVIIVNNAST